MAPPAPPACCWGLLDDDVGDVADDGRRRASISSMTRFVIGAREAALASAAVAFCTIAAGGGRSRRRAAVEEDGLVDGTRGEGCKRCILPYVFFFSFFEPRRKKKKVWREKKTFTSLSTKSDEIRPMADVQGDQWSPAVPADPLRKLECLSDAFVSEREREREREGGRERERGRKTTTSASRINQIAMARSFTNLATTLVPPPHPSSKQKKLILQRRVRRRAFLKKNPEQQAASAIRRGELPRVLGRADLYLLCLGSVIGAGVFVLTGIAARDHAGPSVALAYLFSAGAALLSAVCYLEFAVEAPRAGGAFSYVSVVGGELPAWIVASNLLLEYSLSIAAVARAASAYACTLVGASSPSATLIRIGGGSGASGLPLVELDPLAAAGVLALTWLVASGTAATARFNAVVTLVNLIAILYIVVAAAPLADPARNLTPFAPEGLRGVFAASSVVFFAFVGFDTVATAAEDALDPTADT